MGGLSVHHVKLKAVSMLIRSFMETAANPKYLHNLYHSALFNYHVLHDKSFPDPGKPPYYSEEFFNIIRHAHLHSPLDVTSMTSKQWYHLLLDKVTMTEEEPQQFIQCRQELLNAEVDWENTSRLSRLKGLDSDDISFLWRLLHHLLPTLSRVNRINPNTSPLCKHCADQIHEDINHALFNCSHNRVTSQALMNSLTNYQLNLTPAKVLTLSFEVEEKRELPMVWITTNFLRKVWELRKEKKRCDLAVIRADLESKITLLRETRFAESAEIVTQMLLNL